MMELMEADSFAIWINRWNFWLKIFLSIIYVSRQINIWKS